MKNKSFAIVSMLLSGFAAPLAFAQDSNALEAPAEPQMNRFSVAYRIGLNIKADFKRLGGFTATSNPGPATSGTDHTYDDGYNKVDSTGNDHSFGGTFPEGRNQTWNWGYDNSSQVPPPGNDVILFHSRSSAANASSKDVADDPQHGFEFIYNRRINRAGNGWWGIEAGFGYSSISIGDGRGLRGSVSVLTDAYDLGGVFPPSPPPYRGDATNAGPLISDIPNRSFQNEPDGAIIDGRRNLDADIGLFRIGPYFELPASTNLSFQLSGGFAFGVIDSEFRFRETVRISGLGSQTHSGNSHDGGLVPGGFVAGTVIWKLNEQWDVFANAQYIGLASFSQTASGKKAELNMGESVFVSIGMGFSFK